MNLALKFVVSGARWCDLQNTLMPECMFVQMKSLPLFYFHAYLCLTPFPTPAHQSHVSSGAETDAQLTSCTLRQHRQWLHAWLFKWHFTCTGVRAVHVCRHHTHTRLHESFIWAVKWTVGHCFTSRKTINTLCL